MKKGDILKLNIEDYAFEGKGIAKISLEDNPDKKFIVFVNGAYPGDEVEAQILKKKSSYAEAKSINILRRSENRVEARCKHFGTCGGCKQQDLSYEKQLIFKESQVRDTFERIGGFNDFQIEPIIPSENIFFYRNKLEFSFADKRWLTKQEIGNDESIADRNFALGFHLPRIFDKVLDIDECFLQSKISTDILNFTRNFFKSRNVSIYSTRTHEGFLRNLVIRQSQLTNHLMVNLVTSSQDDDLLNSYANDLKNSFRVITTIINNVNIKKSQVAIGDYEKVYYGEGFIYDKIAEYRFRISANSFFQTNTLQAEKLYKTALEFADLAGGEIIYDLYSGAGTISIYISPHAGEVHAFENVESAIKDAVINNGINNITNIRYHHTDLNKSIIHYIEENKLPVPDVVVIDPPRSGMNPKTVKDVLKLDAGKIVYISCNPSTQARDIKLLCEQGYNLLKMRPVDMFPHTHHIENVALLKRS